MKVLVVGDVMFDRWTTVNPVKLSQEASVLVVSPETEETTLGGAGNVAVNCKHLGADTALAGIVGIDDTGVGTLRDLVMRNDLEDLVIHDDEWTTILKHRIVDRNGQHLLRLDTEKSHAMPSLDATERLIYGITEAAVSANVIVISDYDKGSVPFEIITATRHLSAKHRLFSVVNPKPSTAHFYQFADVLVLNESEANAVHDGIDSLKNKHIIVTRGDRGLTWYNREVSTVIKVPAVKVNVADVSGAGDTIVATIASYGRIDEPVLIEATKNAASVVSQRGTAVPVR